MNTPLPTTVAQIPQPAHTPSHADLQALWGILEGEVLTGNSEAYRILQRWIKYVDARQERYAAKGA